MKRRTTEAELPLQTRAMPVGAVDREKRTANLTWTTGARVPRFDWAKDRPYLEELSTDPKAIRLDRLNGGAPLLNSHSAWRLEDQIGVVVEGTARIERGEGRATVRFSEREAVSAIFEDVASGVIRNVSVGYRVHRFEQIPPENDAGQWIYRATDWEPYEISLVTIPADAGAGVRAEAGVRQFPVEYTMKESEMDEENVIETPPSGPEAERAVRAERARVQEIRKIVRIARLDESFGQRMIDDGTDLAEARAAVFAEMQRRSDENPVRSPAVLSPAPLAAGVHELMSEALAGRAGVAVGEQARPYRRMRLVDMARECLELRGIRTGSLSGGELLERAIATGDLPQLLLGTGNRVLRAAYDAAPVSIKRICRQSTNPDFRAKTKIALSEMPTLEQVAEGAEFQYGAVAEAKEAYTLGTFGRIIKLTRQAIVNDDLGAFNDVSRRYAQSAMQREAEVLVGRLTGNPTMDDGTALFHADHANLAGSGGAISHTTLAAAMAAMRTQTGIDGRTILNVVPRFLVVPAALEFVAGQYMAQIAAAKSSDANPLSNLLEIVVEPRLDDISATAWYLAADPGQIDTIEYSYLEEAQGPQMFVREGWEVDAIEFKCRLDFGAGVLDWRGLYKNPGA